MPTLPFKGGPAMTILTLYAVFLTPTLAHTTSRFQSFFANSARDFASLSSVTCNASLTHFRDLYSNSSAVTAIDLGLSSQQSVIDACRAHESCILNYASEATKASMSTAGVVLGLLPTLLAVLSPSIAEIALLSAQRPVLAMITSLGSPGVLQTRIFEYSDPGELLDMPEEIQAGGKRIRLQLVLGPWRKGWMSTGVAVVEYVLILAAVVNTQWLALELSQKSILSWGCTRAIWPTLLWSCIPLVIDGIGALGYRLTLDAKTRKTAPSVVESSIAMTAPLRTYTFFTKPDSSAKQTTNIMVGPASPPLSTSPIVDGTSNSSRTSTISRISNAIRREFVPSACHPAALRACLSYGKVPSPRVTTGIVLHCIAGFLSFFHLLYGTVTFSGLLFVDTLDAIGQVAMRFLISGLICRFVVLIEVAGMRGAVVASQ